MYCANAFKQYSKNTYLNDHHKYGKLKFANAALLRIQKEGDLNA